MQQITFCILGIQAVSQPALPNSYEEVSLHSFPRSVPSLPFSTYSRVNKTYLLGSQLKKFELYSSPKQSCFALKHHRHFKAESIWRLLYQKQSWVKLSSSQYLRWHLRPQKTVCVRGVNHVLFIQFTLWHFPIAEYWGQKHHHYICNSRIWVFVVLH